MNNVLIVVILIIFLVLITYAVSAYSRMPGVKSQTNYVKTFLIVLIATLVLSFIIYAVINLILLPLLKINNITFPQSILIFIIIVTILLALSAIFYPSRVGIIA